MPTGIVILAVLSGVNYFFAPVDSTTANGGTGNGIQVTPVLPQSPKETVRVVYSRSAEGDVKTACLMFKQPAAQSFAKDLAASSCEQALQGIADKSGYRELSVPDRAVALTGTTATVDSCQLSLSGQRLGVFTLTKQPDNGWAITAHSNSNPPDCLTG